MSVLTAMLLGLIQGLTEFLPVSSSGHLSIFQNLLGLAYAENEHLLFDAMLHVGTLFAVFSVYKKDIKNILNTTVSVLMGRAEEDDSGRFPPAVRTAFFIVIATLPLVLVLPFYDKLETLFTNIPFIAFALIVTGVILFAAGKLEEGHKNDRTSTLADVVLIGLAQAVAVIPGVSRSGATISVGLARGLKREYAAEFSFLLSIPAVIGSALLSLIKAIRAGGVNWGAIPAYILGMAVAAIVGYYAIIILRRILKKDNFGKFAYYCWAVGLVALIASLFIG